MTRREKVQQAILAAIDSRPKDQLGSNASPLAVDEYDSATVNSIADEMEREGLIRADVESNRSGQVDRVIPHGLTERGRDYLQLLETAS